MLLDIAKESSDAFPPLKSCLGFITALIKHYDVRRHQISLDFTNNFHTGMYRCEGQAQHPPTVVGEVAGDLGESEPR